VNATYPGGVLVAVIDTSSAAVTAGVARVTADGVQVLAERVTVDARAHGELLAPSVRDCLAEAGVSMNDIGAVVAGVGPGPFTGLRVGLVTAGILADVLGCPAYGVCSLDAIAAAHPGEPALLVAADARRREVYWASYRDGVRVGEPSVAAASVVAGQARLAGSQAMTGAGAELYEPVLGLRLLGGSYPAVPGTTASGRRRYSGVSTSPAAPASTRSAAHRTSPATVG
jgi:tRNA threonylcarbamoyl adenosine modification protein YeaZ